MNVEVNYFAQRRLLKRLEEHVARRVSGGLTVLSLSPDTCSQKSLNRAKKEEDLENFENGPKSAEYYCATSVVLG